MSAFDVGFEVGRRGGSWWECNFTEPFEVQQWLRGFDAGKSAAAKTKEPGA